MALAGLLCVTASVVAPPPAEAQTVVPALVGADDSKAILVLHTYGHDAPARLVFDAGLARGLREGAGEKVDLYIETLDASRFAGEAQARLMRDYLREKYAGKRIA